MYVEHWTHEEIETYRNNHNLLISKANELRNKVVRELSVRLIRRMTSILKCQGPISAMKDILPKISR